MTTAQHQITNFTSDTPSELKAKLDANSAVAARIAAAFQCYAASTPDMTVKVAAGSLMVNDALTEKAIQTSGTITAPGTHPRIDRVVIDQITGVASIITGAEAASPSAPAITAGKIPVAQIALTTSTTAITNALITDERPFVLFPSIAGLTADGAPDAAADYALVWDASAGAMKKVLLNLIGSSTDQVARDQIALLAIKTMLNTAVTTGPLVQGKQWELATDEWGASSTNETYTAPGSFGYYTNSTTLAQITGGATQGGYTNAGGNAAAFDGTTSQADSASAVTPGAPTGYVDGSALGKDWGVGVTKTVTAFKAWSPTNVGFISTNAAIGIKLQGSNNNSTWDDLYTGTTPSGVGALVDVSSGIATTVAYRYHRLVLNGNGVNGLRFAEINFYETASYLNVTLIPDAAVSVSSAPTYMDAYFLWKDDSGSAVLGTDLTTELSRTGSDWTAASLEVIATYDTWSVIKARANVASQPSGTSMLCRIKTLNNKAQRIAAPAIYAE